MFRVIAHDDEEGNSKFAPQIKLQKSPKKRLKWYGVDYEGVLQGKYKWIASYCTVDTVEEAIQRLKQYYQNEVIVEFSSPEDIGYVTELDVHMDDDGRPETMTIKKLYEHDEPISLAGEAIDVLKSGPKYGLHRSRTDTEN